MAQGFFAGGNGTKENPFLIEDADDLNAMRMHSSSYFELINDINLSNGKYNLNQGWCPFDFYGVLNGKNHKIINLYIDRPTENVVGFFKNVDNNTVIEHIMFVDAKVVGHDYVGVVCGSVGFTNRAKTEIVRLNDICVVKSNVKGNNAVGGFCGAFANTIFEIMYIIYTLM